MPNTPVGKRTRGALLDDEQKRAGTITDFMKKQRPASAAPPVKKAVPRGGHSSGPNWEAAAEKAATSKFRPRAGISKKSTQVPRIDGHVPRGASILIIQQPWIDLILDGVKSLEVRGTICNKPAGEKIYLALSGAGGYLLGSVSFVKCHGPLTRAEWVARGTQHCVAGDALPYGGSTYAWEFSKPQKFHEPVAYNHKQGVVTWAKME